MTAPVLFPMAGAFFLVSRKTNPDLLVRERFDHTKSSTHSSHDSIIENQP